MDYAESRIYQAGDDLRGMHWQLLARMGRPHVKMRHDEHAGHWHGLVDARGTMLFGTRVRTKAQQAARAAPQTSIASTLWRADDLHSRHFGRGLVAVRRLAAWLLAEPLPRPSLQAVVPSGQQAEPRPAGMQAAASPATWTTNATPFRLPRAPSQVRPQAHSQAAPIPRRKRAQERAGVPPVQPARP
ncbi:MAG: DUF58 domain-containing protein [Betaproteobacteria bacterium]|nr:DUF58 domain-containing protein [Betaproteobacteria bacterium]MDE2123851.1 DUF58 domain-containing protein [Betaproteobacteria bacterium]MDE2325883.1 DUF58 domain-containing protein [Betaproteobacteria bacterium]